MEAGNLILGQADELYAVWCSQPARTYGGTADVVTCAREAAPAAGDLARWHALRLIKTRRSCISKPS